MGLVYLGRDPRIGRTVAIKTMALSQEFEGEELEAVKARFFREAETAGRLNHPNIVTIYDVGEEQDLAYIAMDYLQGKPLSHFCKPESLLSLEKVFDIGIQVAEALDYAHQQNVVHRDIKPANIIYDPKTGKVKVTDFGVACLTDSSKTKTGTVLGSPSYMSPEQLAGRKVDGRSDIFSLGITLFQLITGELPFVADSLASLMYKIANEKHVDVRILRPDVPSCVSTIINRALYKDIEKRCQTGKNLANALRRCKPKLEKGS
jgi:serine/threonine-protein kinase